jgi:DNA-binding PucR family transcriptional regulator
MRSSPPCAGGSTRGSRVNPAGSVVGELEELVSSLEEARRAARVGSRLGTEEVTQWSQLGAYRTLARLLNGADPATHVPDSLRRLLAHPDADPLVKTLEIYLNCGCDAKAAVGELYVHRSSLYPRLHRIQDITGVDLSTGQGRLELHLGLRLWHLESGAPALA